MHYLIDGPATSARTFIFAHGAGGAMDSTFMTHVAQALAQRGVRVARFEFPYMAARREGKRSGAPDRQAVLLETWREVIREFGAEVFIGGKSMGGRMASMVADEMGVRGLICLGFPFHPPNQPAKLRTEHLATLRTPTLILQGTRDPFGTREDVSFYTFSPNIRVEWLEDGDHSLKPRKSSGFTEKEHLERAIGLVADMMDSM